MAKQVHQRGRRVAVWSAMGLGCTQLSPILGGYITDRYGWRTQLWIISAFWGVAMLIVFFGCPETAYKRPVPLETDIIPGDSLKTEDMSISLPSGSGTSVSEGDSGIAGDLKSPSVRENIREKVVRNCDEEKRSYLAELLPVRGIESRSNPLVLLLRYCLVALYPAVWCAFLVSSQSTLKSLGSLNMLTHKNRSSALTLRGSTPPLSPWLRFSKRRHWTLPPPRWAILTHSALLQLLLPFLSPTLLPIVLSSSSLGGTKQIQECMSPNSDCCFSYPPWPLDFQVLLYLAGTQGRTQ